MTIEKIADVTNQILMDEFEVDIDAIVPDANMKESLDLDSLDYVDLVVLIESNFGVKLGAKDFEGMVTFEDFYQLIHSKLTEFAS